MENISSTSWQRIGSMSPTGTACLHMVNSEKREHNKVMIDIFGRLDWYEDLEIRGGCRNRGAPLSSLTGGSQAGQRETAAPSTADIQSDPLVVKT
jgi:hypothetical protein